MSKTIKAIALVFLGLIIWTVFAYLALAFIKAEANPFVWSQSARSGMLFIIVCYLCFSPLMVIGLINEM